MKYLNIISLLVVLILNIELSKAQVFASASKEITEFVPEEIVNSKTIEEPIPVLAGCPPASNLGTITFLPSKTFYCPGDNVQVKFNKTNALHTISGNLSWTYGGTAASTVMSGPNNIVYNVNGVTSGGPATVSGVMIVSGQNCPFTLFKDIVFTTLVADAGPDRTYVPCGGPIGIGTSPCRLNGVAPFNPPPTWSPVTGIVGPTQACVTQVNNLTSNQTYVLTVTDANCSVTDQMLVTLACPSANSMCNLSISPSQPTLCPGNNVSGNVNITNSCFGFSGNVTWSNTGSDNVIGSGANNQNYSIPSLSSSGLIQASGNLQLTGGTLICPFTAQVQMYMSDLAANAGPDQVYIPGGGQISIGTSPCELNGNPPYSPAPAWTPATGIVGSSSGCVININNLTNNLTYNIQVSDLYCTASDQMNVTLACPSPTTLGSISISPNQPVYCAGSNISGNFSISNAFFSLNGPVSWNYTGSPAISGSGVNNVNYAISGLVSSGTIQATGNMQVTGGVLVCPYSIEKQVTKSTLTANAGITQVYVPGGGAVLLGSNPCVSNGYPTYNYAWTPATFITSATNICQPTVNSVTTTTTYTLTVTDLYCSAVSTVRVIIGAEPYAVLKKNFDGGYYKITGGVLYFKYDGEYNSGNMTYKIYNNQNTLLYSNSNLALVKNYGDNRYSFNLTSASITGVGYYYFEVINEKNEVFKLKFKI
jgi:hypothetical protein